MITRKITTLVLSFSFSIVGMGAKAQTQKGVDIDGETSGDRSGSAVSMPDANTVAIGAPKNDGNGGNAGQVRIYEWSGSSWTQKGADLDGEAAGDLFGSSVSMPDANTVAVGAPENDGNGTVAGHVRVFEWNGTVWSQKGSDIDGDVPTQTFGDLFGSSVSMPTANTVAVGAPWNAANGIWTGLVRIFDWDGTAWTQRGLDIHDGIATLSGIRVCMPDVNTVAIASQGGSSNAGHVRIFTWDGTAWAQKGNNIVGETGGDQSGNSISMPDANTIAIGTTDNDGVAPDAGHVRIFTWDGTAWTQKGSDIDGEAQGDKSGVSASMGDANTIAIGASLNDDNGSQSGHVRIYNWNGTDWVRSGSDIDGEAANDQSGYAVSMPDANTVAIGAIQNDGGGNEAGHVRIYTVDNGVSVKETAFIQNIQAYPNPTSGVLEVQLGHKYPLLNVSLKTINGSLVRHYTFKNSDTFTIDMEGPAGVYFLQIANERNH
ncbi:MAG TPA: hypothetical protein DIU20_00850, partial [Cryomorphaceae bacterium]|nr:hypothetical protein [Cryomorphaceae bacterium]